MVVISHVLTLVVPSDEGKPVQWLDIPLQHVKSVETRASVSMSSQSKVKKFIKRRLVLHLQSKDWTLLVDAVPKQTATVTIVFETDEIIQEALAAIRARAKESPKRKLAITRTKTSGSQILNVSKDLSPKVTGEGDVQVESEQTHVPFDATNGVQSHHPPHQAGEPNDYDDLYELSPSGKASHFRLRSRSVTERDGHHSGEEARGIEQENPDTAPDTAPEGTTEEMPKEVVLPGAPLVARHADPKGHSYDTINPAVLQKDSIAEDSARTPRAISPSLPRILTETGGSKLRRPQKRARESSDAGNETSSNRRKRTIAPGARDGHEPSDEHPRAFDDDALDLRRSPERSQSIQDASRSPPREGRPTPTKLRHPQSDIRQHREATQARSSLIPDSVTDIPSDRLPQPRPGKLKDLLQTEVNRLPDSNDSPMSMPAKNPTLRKPTKAALRKTKTVAAAKKPKQPTKSKQPAKSPLRDDGGVFDLPTSPPPAVRQKPNARQGKLPASRKNLKQSEKTRSEATRKAPSRNAKTGSTKQTVASEQNHRTGKGAAVKDVTTATKASSRARKKVASKSPTKEAAKKSVPARENERYRLRSRSATSAVPNADEDLAARPHVSDAEVNTRGQPESGTPLPADEVIIARSSEPGVRLVDDHLTRKTPIIKFTRDGPLNQGRHRKHEASRTVSQTPVDKFATQGDYSRGSRGSNDENVAPEPESEGFGAPLSAHAPTPGLDSMSGEPSPSSMARKDHRKALEEAAPDRLNHAQTPLSKRKQFQMDAPPLPETKRVKIISPNHSIDKERATLSRRISSSVLRLRRSRPHAWVDDNGSPFRMPGSNGLANKPSNGLAEYQDSNKEQELFAHGVRGSKTPTSVRSNGSPAAEILGETVTPVQLANPFNVDRTLGSRQNAFVELLRRQPDVERIDRGQEVRKRFEVDDTVESGKPIDVRASKTPNNRQSASFDLLGRQPHTEKTDRREELVEMVEVDNNVDQSGRASDATASETRSSRPNAFLNLLRRKPEIESVSRHQEVRHRLEIDHQVGQSGRAGDAIAPENEARSRHSTYSDRGESLSAAEEGGSDVREKTEWEASLKPHQKDLAGVLSRISKVSQPCRPSRRWALAHNITLSQAC